MNIYAIGASFLGTGVEFVEALTIILAVGVVRGWKSALFGAIAAVVVLGALVTAIGAPLITVIQIFWLQTLVGLFMLLFGIRWLRKAIMRYAGLKALHDETKAYKEEIERQKRAGAVSSGFDRFAFSTAFSGTFLEGLEAIFIVITFGLTSHSIKSSIVGAVLAIVAVTFMGVLLRSPLAKIPENTLKFIVGVMLTSFGAFWIGEGLSVSWPEKDFSIVYIGLTLCVFSWLMVARCKRKLKHIASSNPMSMEAN